MQGDGHIPMIEGMLENERKLYNIIENLYDNRRISEDEYNEINEQINKTLQIFEINGLMSGINLIIKFRDILKEQGL